MVDFLLDNTLGAWHAGKVLAANPKLAENARSEDELRQAIVLQAARGAISASSKTRTANGHLLPARSPAGRNLRTP